MSNFPHARRSVSASRPDLPSLVAMAVAQQALLPTALAVALDRCTQQSNPFLKHGNPSLPFADRSVSSAVVSFHPAIAMQLLTEVQ